MKIIINKWEVSQTTTGKTKATADITGKEGEELTGVTFWKDGWANFDEIKEGTELEGDYVEKQNGQWLNKTFYAPKPVSTGATRSAGAITKAQEKKAEMIEKAQDNKEEGIKVSATMRDAVQCAIAEYNKNPHDLSSLEELIRKWRKVLWFEWDKWSEYPPFS